MRPACLTVQTAGRMSSNQRFPGIVRVDCARHSGPANTKGATHDLRHRRQWNPEQRGHQTARRAKDTVSRCLFLRERCADRPGPWNRGRDDRLHHPATLRAAFQGCGRILLGPNALNQTELELNAVDAASAAGVRHIVKHPSWAPPRKPTASRTFTDRWKRPSRGAVWPGLLRPNSFMQNAVTFMAPTIRAQERRLQRERSGANQPHRRPRHCPGGGGGADSGRPRTKSYTLSGPEALTYDEVADELSKVLGRVIRHVSLPAADLRAGMLAEGMPEALADLHAGPGAILS